MSSSRLGYAHQFYTVFIYLEPNRMEGIDVMRRATGIKRTTQFSYITCDIDTFFYNHIRKSDNKILEKKYLK